MSAVGMTTDVDCFFLSSWCSVLRKKKKQGVVGQNPRGDLFTLGGGGKRGRTLKNTRHKTLKQTQISHPLEYHT